MVNKHLEHFSHIWMDNAVNNANIKEFTSAFPFSMLWSTSHFTPFHIIPSCWKSPRTVPSGNQIKTKLPAEAWAMIYCKLKCLGASIQGSVYFQAPRDAPKFHLHWLYNLEKDLFSLWYCGDLKTTSFLVFYQLLWYPSCSNFTNAQTVNNHGKHKSITNIQFSSSICVPDTPVLMDNSFHFHSYVSGWSSELHGHLLPATLVGLCNPISYFLLSHRCNCN